MDQPRDCVLERGGLTRRTDAFDTVDWSVPLDDRAFHLPPRFCPLYGTPLWEQMTEADRRAYSRHEASAQFAYGMWFENILVNALMRHLYHLPATDPRHRFLLREVAEEARHCEIFGEYIRRSGTPPYLPSLWLRLQGGFMKLTATRATFYLSILGGESFLDHVNRATVRDASLHPTYRRIIELHVAEEEEHRAFAKDYLRDAWPKLAFLSKFWAKFYAPLIVYTIVQASVCEEVYLKLGLSDGYRQAWENPRRRERVTEALSPYAAFLTEIGVLDWMTRPLWRAFRLIP
ncbi:MAG: hypothetical protein CO113_13605 [Elusimicrobia bacterium CG_4_9_14_3_um_filter_62_55]|nr:MAG: hypothetical protein COR54_17495 [Elusimicrobia bacterium CG22_combo_CG10-13_8_21_14_all_63_91]PJA18457.1 MAG: hypothetical protein COX66_00955 [Elusimicrobia bacterium CG_4_10_14_0_2_um_filter_63_34]PJB24520.1 MAG: hypothetical protein CO113_13605 [Elusimicrobia bacterium CG_4_9_14_3_um_filter_62_55]